MLSAVKSALGRARGGLEVGSIHLGGHLPIHALRVAILRLWGAKIGSGVTIYHGLEVRAAKNLVIGDNSSIGNDAILDARAGLVIGANVNLSTGVQIWTGQHDWRASDFAYEKAPVRIGDRAWLSARVIVLPGVSIGEGAVLAAGSVATKDVGEFELVGGVPAKHLADRPRDLTYTLPPANKKQLWW